MCRAPRLGACLIKQTLHLDTELTVADWVYSLCIHSKAATIALHLALFRQPAQQSYNVLICGADRVY